MSYASPERLVWLATLLPIVAVYILRSRLKRRPVATLLFWDELFDEKRQRTWWQRLRHWFSLLLQLAIASTLVIALVDPLWPGQESARMQTVIVVDNSASMAARSGNGSTRLQEATNRAKDVVRGMRDGDQVAVVTAGGVVNVAVGMTDFAPTAIEAIDAIRQTDSPTNVDEAITAAGRMMTAGANRRIVVFSDQPCENDETMGNKSLHRSLIGSSTGNVAITRMAIRRSLVDPIGYAAMIEVQNFSDVETECRLTIELAGDLVDVVPLKLAANEIVRKNVVDASARGGELTASVNVDDALSVDNIARAVLPRRERIPVTLVSSLPSLYLRSVLSAIPMVDLTETTVAPDRSPTGGFLVLHRGVPKVLPGGSVLVIDPEAPSDRFHFSERVTDAIVVKQDPASPLLPHVRLTNVSLSSVRPLVMTDESAIKLLIGASGETLMASLVDDTNRVVVLAANLDEGELPLRIAFPVMMTNAVNFFLSRSGEVQPALATGRVGKVMIGDEVVSVPPVDTVGLVDVNGTQVAVNLCDAIESELRRPDIAAADDGLSLPSTGYRSAWFYAVVAALGLVLGEWFLFQRSIVA